MQEQCPVCLNEAERIADRDYGDKAILRCPRCGFFEISRTAIAMLESRLGNDTLARARLSHNIRSTTSDKNRLSVLSTNLDELIGRPLPSIEQQMENLVHWLAARLKDDRLGLVADYDLDELAGLLGAIDGARVERLIEHAVAAGSVTYSGKGIGLTPQGWTMADPKAGQQKMATPKMSQGPEPEMAHCDGCGGERRSDVRASYECQGGDDLVSWSDKYEILECRGCGRLSVRHKHWFSEWDDFDIDPYTGKQILVPGIRVEYWPSPTTRRKPDWADRLEDAALRSVMDEVYQALNAGLVVLAAMGTRTLLDRAMYLRLGHDPEGGFRGKLKQMVAEKHIGEHESTVLEAITDAGSAAAHRGFEPSAAVLENIVDTVENFLYREFFIKESAGAVKAATPRRQRTKRSTDA